MRTPAGLISSSRTGRQAVFLDRDGTVNREVAYLRDPRHLRLLPGVAAAIRRLNEAGFAVVILTNQSGVARGFLDEATLAEIHRLLLARLARRGAVVDAIYHCPHHPDDGCQCRKPARGMLHRAVRELGIQVAGSYVVGDSACDVALADRTSLGSVLLLRRGEPRPEGVRPDQVASSLPRAVTWILSAPRASPAVPGRP